MKNKIRGTTASYKTNYGSKCNLDELAEIYSSVGNVPERVGFAKASEITLLAKMYLHECEVRKILEARIEKLESK